MTNESSKPVTEFRSHGVKAAVWTRDKETKEGRKYVEHSVTITKSYRDDKGKWHTTDNYFANDLPHLILVASKAFEFVSLHTSETS